MKSTVGKEPAFSASSSVSQLPVGKPVGVQAAPASGGDRVLVMDDESTVLKVTERLLTMTGYEVTAVSDGSEAIDRYREAMEQQRPFGVAILDLTVPAGMGGAEAVRGILAIDPAANVIVSSGYSSDPILANYAEFGFRDVIVKPYDVQRLREVIQSLLGRDTGTA